MLNLVPVWCGSGDRPTNMKSRPLALNQVQAVSADKWLGDAGGKVVYLFKTRTVQYRALRREWHGCCESCPSIDATLAAVVMRADD